MKKLIAVLFLFILFAASIAAWNTSLTTTTSYTYQTDKQFHNVHQFVGQRILPQSYQIGNATAVHIDPGEVQINITANTVRVKGIKKLGNFKIAKKTVLKDGFSFVLFQNGAEHLMRFATDSLGHLQDLRFTSPRYGHYQFDFASKTATQLMQEEAYFTAKNLHTVRGYDDLVGKSFYPEKQELHANTIYAITEKIPTTQQLHIQFDADDMYFKTHDREKKYSYRNAKMVTCSIRGNDAVSKRLDIRVNRKEKIKLYLNKQYKIEFIEVQGVRYLLRNA